MRVSDWSSDVCSYNLELDHTEPYGDELEIAFLPCGETLVELIRPLTEEGFSADWLASAGPAIQHVAVEVDDLDAALRALAAQGVRRSAEPRGGKECFCTCRCRWSRYHSHNKQK